MICNHCLKDQPLSNFERDKAYRRKVCKACRVTQKKNSHRKRYAPKKPRIPCEFCAKITTADDGVCGDSSKEIYHSFNTQVTDMDGKATRLREWRIYKSAADKCVCPPATRIRMRKAAERYGQEETRLQQAR